MTIPDPEALSSAYEPEFSAKRSGAFFTPESVSQSLVHWACRSPSERMLDPSCGDGEFLRHHWNSVGIEQNPVSAHQAMDRAPGALVHEGDFFAWAADTSERFECAAGNPPFIRYQTFKGPVRQRALALCSDLGAHFSGLSSSWAPFLVATASLLKPGGRMAFVVPAEIGHAPYAAPLLHYLTQNFERVQVVAVREKLFPHLSEDCWLLFAEGFSGQTDSIRFTLCDRFDPSQEPPSADTSVLVSEWEQTWQNRLRSLILPDTIREIYRMAADDSGSHRLGDFARIGIGYVSGDNRFFHLTPLEAKRWGIPDRFLLPSVRNSRSLPPGSITRSDVEAWKANDAPYLLLRLPREGRVPVSVANYLESAGGMAACKGYKCRTRSPWYAVPDVRIPDYVMTYMSGRSVKLVRNDAGVTCTNSLHAVNLTNKTMAKACLARWSSPFTQLSCEIEGHALGGGMLKLEPREARRVLFPPRALLAQLKIEDIEASTHLLQSWRHYADRP